MSSIDLDVLLQSVAKRAGIPRAPTAEVLNLVEATLTALASELPTNDVRALAQTLPSPLGFALRASELPGGFFERVAQSALLDLPAATERAESVLRVVGDALPAELLTRMIRHLPAHVARHLQRESASPPPPHPTHANVRGNLASGRPGSAHPLSESRPIRK